MSETWTISVGGRSYGPYALEQMKAFQAEGRLAPHSLVARAARKNFIMPARMRELALLFPGGAARASRQPPRQFRRNT